MKARIKSHEKIIALFLSAILMLTSVPIMTYAADFQISGGTAGTDYTYENDTVTILTETPLTLSGDTSNTQIIVSSSANLTFSDYNSTVSNGNYNNSLLTVGDNLNVNITLSGSNTLKASQDAASSPVTVTIADTSTVTFSGNGSIEITGTSNYAKAGTAVSGGNIIVDGASVKLTGGNFVSGEASTSVAFSGKSLTVKSGSLETSTSSGSPNFFSDTYPNAETVNYYGGSLNLGTVVIDDGEIGALTLEDGQTLTLYGDCSAAESVSITNNGTINNYANLSYYKDTFSGNDVQNKDGGTVTVNNRSHSYDDNGICTNTEGETHYQPAVYNETDNVYEIGNAGQLAWFGCLVNGDTSQEGITEANASANGKLTKNIDLQYVCSKTLGDWTPIGNYNDDKNYAGTFDGNGKTVSNLYINNSKNFQGLFGRIYAVHSYAEIKNLTVSGEVTGGAYVGGICGENNDVIKNCYNVGTIKGDDYRVGGVCGYSNGTISNCYNTGTVDGYLDVGGVCGLNVGTISNCYSTGAVTGNTSVGGVCGTNSVTVNNCYNIGAVTANYGNEDIQGVCGYNLGTLNNCYYLDTMKSDENATAKSADEFKSGEVAYLLNSSVTDGTQAWYQNIDNDETADDYPVFSGGTVYYGYKSCNASDMTYTNSKPVSASGHEYDENGICTKTAGETHYQPAEYNETDNVYEISNAGQLAWFACLVNGDTSQENITEANTSANGKLMNDIDLQYVCSETLGNWSPIGYFVSYSDKKTYGGTFDGNDKTVSNIYINIKSNDQGLFGYIGSTGTVKNITVSGTVTGIIATNNALSFGGICGANEGTITNCTNAAAVSAYCYVGGICGFNDGTITNCTNTGEISNRGSYASDVGGICGINNGTIENCSNSGNIKGRYAGGICGDSGRSSNTISNCYNTGDITGTYSIGGICGCFSGHLHNSITSCYNTGNVTGTEHVGGICGYFPGSDDTSITNCYNIGNITGTEDTGGICGYFPGSDDSSISKCYNTGNVTGTVEYIGGICGYFPGSDDTSITNCYNTGNVIGAKETGGICGYFVGYDFSSISNCYNIGSVSCDKYGGGVCGNNFYDELTNCYYLDTVTADENATAKTAEQFKSGEVAYLLNSSVTDGTQAFYQNLDNGKTADDYPVFSGGTVYYGYKSCTATDMIYTNSKASSASGHEYDENGICTKTEGEIHYQPAVYNETDNVYEISNAGQLAWFACLVNGDTSQEGITDSKTSANGKLMNDIDLQYVCSETLGDWTPIGNSSKTYSGTFDGAKHEIKNLYINNTKTNQALFGYMKGAVIKNLTVSGSVSAGSRAAGICAQGYGGTITNCQNNCSVSGADQVAGILGRNGDRQGKGNCTVTICANTGKITGTGNDVGGICGYSVGVIDYCYNLGDVSGNNRVGGICGNYNTGEIGSCYNMGNISGSNNVFSIAYSNVWYYTPLNCYHLQGTGNGKSSTAKTAEQFKSGEVCYLLNNNNIWRQTLGEDDYPVFSGEKVYRVILTDYSGANSDVNFYINLGNAITTPDAYASGYSFKSSDTLYESLGDITISGDTTITAIPAPTYTVTIPADVSMDEADKADGVYTVSGVDVSAESKWLYANGKTLAVSVASANDFELKVNGGGTGIPYTYTLGGSVVTQNSEILKFALTDDKQASLSGSISVNESDVKYSGNFTDTLTFTVALADAPAPIEVSTVDELMDAVNNSSLDTKIVLTSDIDLPASEYDLKGHTISSSGGTHSISVYNVSEAVTLKNAKIIDSDSYKCCLYIYRAADVTLENISSITSYKYPLQITNSQTVTINNCYFKSSANYGIFSNSDDVHLNLTITDSTLIGSENGLFVYSNSNYAKVTLQDEVVFDASDDNFYFGRSTLTVGKGYTEV